MNLENSLLFLLLRCVLNGNKGQSRGEWELQCSACPLCPPALGNQACTYSLWEASALPISNMMIKVLEMNVLTGPGSSRRGAFLSLSCLIWPG